MALECSRVALKHVSLHGLRSAASSVIPITNVELQA